MDKYKKLYTQSLEDPDEFWDSIAQELVWDKSYEKVLDQSDPPFYRWFVGGKMNTCYNAVDRWALDDDTKDENAYIWESPETKKSETITYEQLFHRVNRFASVLKEYGIKKGDRVVIYLPMIPEACVAALSCARIGAIHSIVFAGFSRESLAYRIDDAKPKILICADAGHRGGKPVPLKGIVDDAQEMADHKVDKVLVVNRGLAEHTYHPEKEIYWKEAIQKHEGKRIPCEPMKSTDPLYILYTSGTTGKPKGVLRDNGGHMVALYYSMKSIYGMKKGQVYWAASDIGWVVGHSYIIYGPLFMGLTSIIYEGTPIYPDPSIWFKIIEKYNVNCLFTSPTAFRILKKYDEKEVFGPDLSSLHAIFLAGEPLDAPTWKWATEKTGNIPIVDHYWQTETGWSILANPIGVDNIPIKPGSPTFPVWGWNLMVVDEEGNEVEPNTKGYLVAIPPTPPAVLLTVYGNDERYVESYYKNFPGKNYFSTGDYAIKDEEGYYYVLGRADEVIKVAGHRLGTREIEEAISAHQSVAEVCTIGVADEEKGAVPVATIVLKQNYKPSDELKTEINTLVRENLGPIAKLHRIEFVKKLPKTRSGKIIRRVIKNLFEGKEVGDISTIEDKTAIAVVKNAIQR